MMTLPYVNQPVELSFLAPSCDLISETNLATNIIFKEKDEKEVGGEGEFACVCGEYL